MSKCVFAAFPPPLNPNVVNGVDEISAYVVSASVSQRQVDAYYVVSARSAQTAAAGWRELWKGPIWVSGNLTTMRHQLRPSGGAGKRGLRRFSFVWNRDLI